jgi:Carboxypeptidase regulatory-like domain
MSTTTLALRCARSIFGAWVAAATLLLLTLSSINAQLNTSTIAGIVTDETGSVVPRAKVNVVLSGTGQQRETVTNDTGEFVVPQLAPGSYRVTVQAMGFQTAVVESVTLNITERATLNVSLRLGHP